MNKQEIFETVVRHLHQQGEPAVIGEGNCRYRADDGKSCAVGCLIPDDCYDPQMEGMTSSMPRVKAALRLAGILTGGADDREISRLLDALQYAHDCWEGSDGRGYEWGDEFGYLEDVRGTHNLTWPEDVPHG